MSIVDYGGFRFILLRNGNGRLGLRNRQAALMLRSNGVREGWTDQTGADENWTPVASAAESWTNK